MDSTKLCDEEIGFTLPEYTLLDAIKTHFPSPINSEMFNLSKVEKIEKIAEKFRDIMCILGLDLTNDSLEQTPTRVAKMYVEEVFSGLDAATFPRITLIEDTYQHDIDPSNMVFVKSEFYSFCEHHFVPMNGMAYVAYIPNGKLIGLSKIPRIIRFFARRPQIQERLTAQIADALSIVLGTESVAVTLQAEHHCVKARGIENENSEAITNVLRGQFSKIEVQNQFFESMRRTDLSNPH